MNVVIYSRVSSQSLPSCPAVMFPGSGFGYTRIFYACAAYRVPLGSLGWNAPGVRSRSTTTYPPGSADLCSIPGNLMNGLSQKKNPFLMNGYILDLVTCFENRGFTKHYNAKIVIIG